MGNRGLLTSLAVPAVAAALAGGLPASAGAASQVLPRAAGFGPLTPALAAQLSHGADDPVLVILRNQAGPAPASGAAARAAVAAVGAAQRSLTAELQQVRATAVRRFTLVNSVAATVSSAEAQRLAADPAVARVIPDVTFSVADPAVSAGLAPAVPQPAPTPVKMSARPPRVIPGACAPRGRSQLAPEGLTLTGTESAVATTPTARSLGFNGGGVKVGYIADGLDPGNANFKRGGGTSVFSAYEDFTGNGTSAPTAGGEAFLDATTIAGQGLKTYNVNGFGAQEYPGTCDVKIQGIAPGASLVGLDIFSGDQADQLTTTTSTIAQAIDYAVENAKVNVLNESFGDNPIPDTAQDVVRQFDDAAVRAGVTVSVSTGDAGTANTIGSPATDPKVISVGASTQFQAVAQANIGGARYFATTGWRSGNISAFSSAGFDEAAGTVDLVAPGDLSWASCTADRARYSDCVSDTGRASDIEVAGGTSESAPFVSGAAALVIQAFRHRHRGRTPTPAQVKHILLSTASDLGVPAQEQGAGLLDTYRAVQLAQSYGRTHRTGSTVLVSSGQLSTVTQPGTAKSWRVTVTNEGGRRQRVAAGTRTLAPTATSSASGSVTLNRASKHFTADTGAQERYAAFRFRVPAHQGHLAVSIAFRANPSEVGLAPNLTLYDPTGRVAAESEPQGVGNYGAVDVCAPASGRWTAVVGSYPAAEGGYQGAVTWRAVTQNYASFGAVSPKSLSLAPGQSGHFTVAVNAPASPGDLAGSVLLHTAGNPVTTIPVVVRSEIDAAAGGRFTGVLTGGNGRGALGTGDYYQFQVPPGTKAIRAELALRSNPPPGQQVGAYLVSPDGDVLASGQNSDLSGAQLGLTEQALTATALNPAPGRWTLIIAFGEPVSGATVSDAFTGSVSFAAAGTLKPKTPLPNGEVLAPGHAVTIPVTVTNTSNAPQDYFLDPRLGAGATLTLAPVVYGSDAAFAAGPPASKLPLAADAPAPFYFVPSHTTAVEVQQVSTVPAMTDLSSAIGDPDVGSAGLSRGPLCGKSVWAAYTPAGGAVTPGAWVTGPAECGPFRRPARAGTADETVSAATAAFDPDVAVQTGDLEQLAVRPAAGVAALAKAVEVQPGKSATVNVTFTPRRSQAGQALAGTLYLNTVQSGVPPYGQGAADEVAALPYRYTVGA